MDKIKFSWSNYLQKADSLVDFVKTSEPEVILEKIYGEILTTIQKEPEFYEYYLKTAVGVPIYPQKIHLFPEKGQKML